METAPQITLTTKNLFAREDVQAKFKEMLGKKAQGFITSVLQIAMGNDKLAQADPMSIYNAAATAATMDLPLNNNLGFAYIVPYQQSYKDSLGKWQKKQVAQFQMGYKGFIQLALRSGQFQTINAVEVRDGEIKKRDRLSGFIDFEWIQNEAERLQKPIIGYISFFRLLNGFEKSFFMTIEQTRAHGAKYSKTYSLDSSKWKEDFDGMSLKTVLKLNLSKYGPMSVDMERAVISDQAVINDFNTQDVTYVDNEPLPDPIDKEHERVMYLISDATTVVDLEDRLRGTELNDEQMNAYQNKVIALTDGK